MYKYNHKILGDIGEEIVAHLINENGLKIIQRNFRCRFGEIDIIAQDGEIVVFIEVKTRTNKKFGEAEESVDSRKKRRLRQIAGYYLMVNKCLCNNCRFDVCSVYLDQTTGSHKASWKKNCF